MKIDKETYNDNSGYSVLNCLKVVTFRDAPSLCFKLLA